jgi:hypothetical protein
MSVGAILGRTTNYLFRKLNFDFLAWHTYEHQNWDDLDAILQGIASAKGIKGPWTNSLAVVVGDRYIDTSSGITYVALVSHTTPASGSFATDRAANPSRWALDTVANNSITFAKLQQIATSTILGRLSAGTGNSVNPTVQQVRDAMNVVSHGQCRLDYVDTTTIKLNPHNGNKLIIGDRVCTVPSGGVQYVFSGLSNNTTYFVFAVDGNGDGIVDGLFLHDTGTSVVTDATTGVAVSSTSRTRTLVGMVRVGASAAWADTLTKRFVRSYFNRQKVELRGVFSAFRTTTSTTLVEVDQEIRVEFIVFDSDIVNIQIGSFVTHSSAAISGIGPSFDGVIPPIYGAGTMNTGVYRDVARSRSSALSTGYHYATLFGYTESGTVSLGGGTLGGHIT